MPKKYSSQYYNINLKSGKISKHKRKNKSTKLVIAPSAPKTNLLTTNRNTPFARNKAVKFKYVDYLTLTTSGTGLPGVYSFRTNSMFDPDFTGTGHQPLFRDVMSNIYGRYRVDKMKYKITCCGGAGGAQMLWGVLATQDTSYNPALTGIEDTLEKRGAGQWRFDKSGAPATQVRGTIDNAKLCGVSKQQYRDEHNYSAAIGNNPVQIGYLSIITQEHYGAINTSVKFMVELEYDAVYYEPRVQPQN